MSSWSQRQVAFNQSSQLAPVGSLGEALGYGQKRAEPGAATRIPGQESWEPALVLRSQQGVCTSVHVLQVQTASLSHCVPAVGAPSPAQSPIPGTAQSPSASASTHWPLLSLTDHPA